MNRIRPPNGLKKSVGTQKSKKQGRGTKKKEKAKRQGAGMGGSGEVGVSYSWRGKKKFVWGVVSKTSGLKGVRGMIKEKQLISQ